MKIKDLKTKSAKDLQMVLEQKHRELLKMRFSLANKQLKNVRDIPKAKKTIARVLTILNQTN